MCAVCNYVGIRHLLSELPLCRNAPIGSSITRLGSWCVFLCSVPGMGILLRLSLMKRTVLDFTSTTMACCGSGHKSTMTGTQGLEITTGGNREVSTAMTSIAAVPFVWDITPITISSLGMTRIITTKRGVMGLLYLPVRSHTLHLFMPMRRLSRALRW